MTYLAFALLFAVMQAPEPEPAPEPVFLGVDCSQVFTVSLPDDVLTECEGELTGR